MYYANCEWYVDMGEHNKPLCAIKNLRPAKCSECPVYIGSIEDENAKLRELAKNLYECNGSCERCVELMGRCEYKEQLVELGIEAEDV